MNPSGEGGSIKEVIAMNFSQDCKIIRVMNGAAAGTDDTLTGTHVDMSGFEGVTFIALIGTVTAGGTVKLHAEQGALSDDSDMADLADTQTATAASNKLLVLDISNPMERYVRPVLDRATANVVVDGIVAILYGAHGRPVAADSSVSALELHVSPSEGSK